MRAAITFLLAVISASAQAEGQFDLSVDMRLIAGRCPDFVPLRRAWQAAL
jgi:hypothetical protein